MDRKKAFRTFFIIVTILIVVGILTYFVSLFIRGYRPNFQRPGLGFMPTGILVASSDPKGATVFIDGRLVTATDDTLSLPPEDYNIKIEKDGFLSWQKNISIKKEIVTQTNTILFRSTPNLSPLTNTGAINATASPDRTRIVYGVSEASRERDNGIWLLDLATSLPLNRANTRQLTGPIYNIDWENTTFNWASDNRNVLLIENDESGENVNRAYFIETTRFISSDELSDVSFRLDIILEEWEQEKQADLEIHLQKLPEELRETIVTSAENLIFSPNEEKLVYLATDSAKIAENLSPHPPARSTQPEEREITPGNFYVYDLREDTNFNIGRKDELLQLNWLTPNHLIYIDQENDEVKIIEADATNQKTIYSGPFVNNYVFPSPNGKSLITLTSLRPDSPGNLYEIKVR